MESSWKQSSTHGVGVFIELRRRLQSGLLIVGKEVAASPADVVVKGGDSSLIIQTPRGNMIASLPPGVVFEEGSCIPTPAGESHGEELHFRLRISVHCSRDRETLDSVMQMLRAKETYCFYCQNCSTRLVEDRSFKRVLPLPNGNWNALVDDWCCHPDPFANKKLLPRQEDCLTGDTFILLARDGSCDQTLVQELSPAGSADSQDPKKPCRRLASISCRSCSAVLGEAVAPETLRLYITQVIVEPAVGDRKASINRSEFLERTVAVRLLELANSLSTFHFTVQTPDGKTFLLLWLLNSDSITASLPENSFGSPELQHQSSQTARALKVLHISCSEADSQQREIISSWEDKAIGHPVVLLPEVCEELQQVMDDSNNTLPASMRHMRSYKVAYLRLG
ncbi:E3 ubiquitin-protein ligase E3D [Synchiropus splendidus]|uniref:E3 ubiquitin-protein ligase E3D n=1 Tax=Synchiropus splendidus TaxID=270530 RepID=UPI00237D9FBB|nr:E3 ubiquitin-protein ligase E3D [Synchiropus splendidus]XP_053737737.1 E3 ubiquitin-protein ligase E3D [Synchiropus splendidus]